jgi:type I restriction enzyme S subunit
LVDKEFESDKFFADQLTQLENLNQAILQEAVQGKLVKQDPKDEPASELLRRIKAEKAKSGKKEKTLTPIKPEEIPFEIPENWVWCRLGEICEVNPRNKVDDEIDAGFIPMPMVSQLFGVRPTYEVRKWGAIKAGFTHFANNDVVVAKITPCFENSKAGIISDLPNGIGAGTTELNVLRGNQYVLPEYIYAFVKRIVFLKNGERIMKGVAGQQRVPTDYFYNTLIPLPPLSEQKRIVAEIEKQFAKTKQLKEHIIANQQATEQLLQALLHQAFEVREVETV